MFDDPVAYSIANKDYQGNDWFPPRIHFGVMDAFVIKLNEPGDKTAHYADLHKYLLHAQDLYGGDENTARERLHLPERFIGDNRFLSESEWEQKCEDEVRAAGEEHGSDDDDEEDMMNMPPSYVAPFHHPEDLHSTLSGTRAATKEEVELISQHRTELETKIKEDLTHQQHDAETAAEGPSLGDLEELAGAVPIAPGVVLVDPVRLELLSEEPGVSYGSGPVPDGYTSTPPRREFRPEGSRRVSFADKPTVIDDPFQSTLKHFKGFQGTGVDDSPRGRKIGKENSPYKPRRKASLPEEIAELNREASAGEASANSDEDLSDLEKYREYDLAPLDPVMEADSAGDLIAGDLIMAKSSPVVNKQKAAFSPSMYGKEAHSLSSAACTDESHEKASMEMMREPRPGCDFDIRQGFDLSRGEWELAPAKKEPGATIEPEKAEKAEQAEQHETPPITPSRPARYALNIPCSEISYSLYIEANVSPDKIAEQMRETATQLGAKDENIEKAVHVSTPSNLQSHIVPANA